MTQPPSEPRWQEHAADGVCWHTSPQELLKWKSSQGADIVYIQKRTAVMTQIRNDAPTLVFEDSSQKPHHKDGKFGRGRKQGVDS